MTSFESIGERIKKLRKEKKLTQYDLADKVGTTHCSISTWEEGKRNMSVYYFARLSKYQLTIYYSERSRKNEKISVYYSCTADNDLHGKL